MCNNVHNVLLSTYTVPNFLEKKYILILIWWVIKSSHIFKCSALSQCCLVKHNGKFCGSAHLFCPDWTSDGAANMKLSAVVLTQCSRFPRRRVWVSSWGGQSGHLDINYDFVTRHKLAQSLRQSALEEATSIGPQGSTVCRSQCLIQQPVSSRLSDMLISLCLETCVCSATSVIFYCVCFPTLVKKDFIND